MAEPTTREEALQQAADWAAGRSSHWNEILTNAGDDPMARAVGMALCPAADATEALRLTTLATILPAAELLEGEDGNA